MGAARGVDLRPVGLATTATAAGAIDLVDAGNVVGYALAAIARLGAVVSLVAVEDALDVESGILARSTRAAAAALGKTAGIAVVVVRALGRGRRETITIAAAGANQAVCRRCRLGFGESAASPAAIGVNRSAIRIDKRRGPTLGTCAITRGSSPFAARADSDGELVVGRKRNNSGALDDLATATAAAHRPAAAAAAADHKRAQEIAVLKRGQRRGRLGVGKHDGELVAKVDYRRVARTDRDIARRRIGPRTCRAQKCGRGD